MSSLRSRRRMRKVQPQTMRRHGCTLTNSQKMAKNERQGLFIDFTDRSLLVRDSTTELNRFNSFGLTDGNGVLRGPTAALTYTAPSVKMTMRSNGLLGFAPHNYVIYSDDLSNASWVKTRATITGTDTLVEDSTAASSHQAIQTTGGTLLAGAAYTISVKIKPINRTWVAVGCNGNPTNSAGWFDLSGAGTVGTRQANCLTSSISPADADGYYLCTITFVAGATATAETAIYCATADNTVSHNGNSLAAYQIKNIHHRRTPSDSTYLSTTTAARYALPYQWTSAGVLEGLLVEEARTNYCLYSQSLENAYWDGGSPNLTITAPTVSSPFGTTTGVNLLVPTSTDSFHRVYRGTVAQLGSSSPCVMWGLFKAAGYTQVGLRESTTTGAGAGFLLSGSGTAYSPHSAGAVTASNATIEHLGNGWYLCAVTLTPSGAVNMGLGVHVLNGSYTSGDVIGNTYAGDTTSGIYSAGVQFESGSFRSSFIQTFASTVTRAADNISLATSAFPFSAGTATCFAEVNQSLPNSVYGTTRIIGNYYLYFSIAGKMRMFDGTNVTENALAQTVRTTFKAAVAYSGATSSITSNGSSVTTGVYDGTPQDSTAIGMGASISASEPFCGLIKKIMVLPRRMSDAELQTLTT